MLHQALVTFKHALAKYREYFLPMSELSGNVKQLCGYLNQVFLASGGVLFLVTTEAELKQLLMDFQ